MFPVERMYGQSTSEFSSSHFTSPFDSFSIGGQCLGGTRRPSSFHWSTAARVTPNFRANAVTVLRSLTRIALSIGCSMKSPLKSDIYRKDRISIVDKQEILSLRATDFLYDANMEIKDWISN